MASNFPFRRSKSLIGMTLQGMAWDITTTAYITATTATVDLTTNLRGDSVNFGTSLADITSDVSPLKASYVIEDEYSGSLTLYYDITADPIPLLTQIQSYDAFKLKRTYAASGAAGGTKVLTTYHVRAGLSSDGAGKGEQLITLQLGSLGIQHTWTAT